MADPGADAFPMRAAWRKRRGVGMFYFRHKTRHWYFVVGMPLILAVQIAVAVWLSNGGAGFTFA